jgi:hypothetical protein
MEKDTGTSTFDKIKRCTAVFLAAAVLAMSTGCGTTQDCPAYKKPVKHNKKSIECPKW